MHLRPQALRFQQGIGLGHRRPLDVKGQDPALRPRQSAKKRRVPALARRGVHAHSAGSDGMPQKIVDQAQGVQLHDELSFQV